MSEHDYYVTYRLASERIRERTRQTERTPSRDPRTLQSGRHAFARRLHSLADLLDG